MMIEANTRAQSNLATDRTWIDIAALYRVTLRMSYTSKQKQNENMGRKGTRLGCTNLK